MRLFIFILFYTMPVCMGIATGFHPNTPLAVTLLLVNVPLITWLKHRVEMRYYHKASIRAREKQLAYEMQARPVVSREQIEEKRKELNEVFPDIEFTDRFLSDLITENSSPSKVAT